MSQGNQTMGYNCLSDNDSSGKKTIDFGYEGVVFVILIIFMIRKHSIQNRPAGRLCPETRFIIQLRHIPICDIITPDQWNGGMMEKKYH